MRKSVKKIAAFGMMAVMAVSMLAGCGGGSNGGDSGKSDGGSKKLTMSLWDEEQKKVMDKMLAKYTEETGVEVETQLTTWTEYWTKLEASVTGGSSADVVWMNVPHIQEYVDAGILMDLSDIGTSLDVNTNFPKALVDGYTIDGKLYAVPKDFDTNALFYNKEIFDKAGVAYPTDDWTFEDMRKAAEDLKAANLGEGYFPIAINYNSGQTTYNGTVYANGGWFYSDDYLEQGWDDPKTIAGIQPWVDMVLDGLSPTLQQMTDTEPDAMFESGKLAMYMAGDYMIASWMQNETIAGKFDCVQRPSFNGKRTDIINGLGYAIPANTKNPEEAKKLVEWLGGKEAMDMQGQGGCVISARNESQKLFLDVYPEMNLKAFIANLDDTYLLPTCKVESEITQMRKGYIQKVWNGEMTLEDAAKKICEEGKPILEKAYKK